MKKSMFGWVKYAASAFGLIVSTMNSSHAGTAYVSPVMIESVAIINVAALGHHAGNLEIKVANGFGNPEGVTCDSNYITTRNTGEGFKDMLSILLAARISKKTLLLAITDDAAHNAYPGRCSLVAVSL